jgi:iron complex outermembrane receptor protein
MRHHRFAISASAALIGLLSSAAPAHAAELSPEQKAERKLELQRQLQAVQQQIDALDEAPAAVSDSAVAADPNAVQLDAVVVTGERIDVVEKLRGQTVSSVSREQFENMPAVSIGEVLALTPGVTFLTGNGPRDVSISVRGSNARQTFGVRNIKVFEDGFPVTQPDGLARTDLTDPHAYQRIDVVHGPSSAVYGNYATGGAIDFHTRTGSDIQGIEGGADFGSDGYFNEFLTAGSGDERFEYSAFISNVRGDPDTEHTRYQTTTVNLLSSWQATPNDRLTFKLINNDLDADLSIRLSLAQYELNPFQKHCADPSAAGCASTSVFVNGFNGAKQNISAETGRLGRDDRRTIVGGRWEHAFDEQTDLRTQVTFDNRDISQPTGNTSFTGTYPSFNFSSDLQHRGEWLARASTVTMGVFANVEDLNYAMYNLTPSGSTVLGGQTQHGTGQHLNAGARLREELQLAPRWTAVAGVGAEYTHLQAKQDNYLYPADAAPTITRLEADREFVNAAPEIALLFAPSAQWQLHARTAAAYGTPQVSNLFVTPDGVFGNNTQLKAQRNIGLDLGAEWNVARQITASVTGFYEFFRNELVTQSAGANLQSYTFNAPKSEHRGIEAALDWHFLPNDLPGAHLSLSYLLDDQIYKDYSERLSAGTGASAVSTSLTRDGNDIPGVIPNYLNTRLIYDQPAGLFAGLGGFVEFSYRDGAVLDNANLLETQDVKLVNLNLHYAAPAGRGLLSRVSVYVAVQNLFDKTYVASASNLSNTLNPAGEQNGVDVLRTATGSIYAGAQRSIFGGLRVKF